MADNEHATAPLGHSEVLSVEKSPDCAAPRPRDHTRAAPASGGNIDGCAHEGSQDRCEVHAPVAGQGTGHVLPHGPPDAEHVSHTDEIPEEPGPLAVKAGAPARNAQVLARRPSNQHVHRLKVGGIKRR